MITRKRNLVCQDLYDFVVSTDESMLSDACKIRILIQFLSRYRLEFETDLEFEETLQTEILLFKIQH